MYGDAPAPVPVHRRLRIASLIAAALVSACTAAPKHQPHLLPNAASPIPLPPGFPPPITPVDNPLTIAKAELGRFLFYDRRLSLNQSQSCATCHQQKRAFTDGHAHAVGSTGQEHYRNTMTLTNVAYRRPLTWADPEARELEKQLLVPLTNDKPVELGMKGRFGELTSRLAADPRYQKMFAAAFPGEQDPITIDNAARAIASFERTLLSGSSAYDRLERYGDTGAMSDSAWRGMRLFFSARLACSSCHGGPDFSTPVDGVPYQDNGTIADTASITDRGLSDKTSRRRDRGKFRVPTLRNIAVTAPYMHDGSAATLSEVIDDYAAGGHAARVTGRKPRRGVRVRPFAIAPNEKQDLIAFLESLTDDSFLTDPRFSDPWSKRAADASSVPPASAR